MFAIENSTKQIIYNLKTIIFFIHSNFSSTYTCESLSYTKNLIKPKEQKSLTDETIAACVSLKINKNNVINL